jgi:hypothetical protein
MKERDDWADDDDENAAYYDVLCAPDGTHVEVFNGCLIARYGIVSSDERKAIVAHIASMKQKKEKEAKVVAKVAAAAIAPEPKKVTGFPVLLYDLLAKDCTRIMGAKMRFAIGSNDDSEVYTQFNVHDDRFYVETLGQSLGVLLQKAYWYYSPAPEKDNLLSIGELKTRLDEARMALRRIPCELVLAEKKVQSLQAKLDASTTEDQQLRYGNKIVEAQLAVNQLQGEERQRTAEIAEYERQRALRSSASSRPKAKVESPEFAMVMRAIKSLNTRNKKSEEFLADFMAYAATFHVQTAEEKFNEDIATAGVSLNFRPTPARREVAVAAAAAVPAAPVVAAPAPAAAPAAAPADAPAAAPADAPAVRAARAPRQQKPQPERKGPSKSDRLAALMGGGKRK